MFQIFVVGNPFQFLLNNLLDFLLDSPVILLHRFLHAVVTVFVREVGNDGYLLVGFFLALIPPSKISGLTQGMFVGSVSDNFNERIEQKIFHCEIVVDAEKVKREEKAYKKIPVITDFTDEDGNDCMKEAVQANYRRIKEEVKQIVKDELERIAGDENLKHLLQQK